jgi:hypothetical protein
MRVDASDAIMVRRHLARLEKDGLIKRILQPRPGRRNNLDEHRLIGPIINSERYAKEIAKRAEERSYRKARANKKGQGLRLAIKP